MRRHTALVSGGWLMAGLALAGLVLLTLQWRALGTPGALPLATVAFLAAGSLLWPFFIRRAAPAPAGFAAPVGCADCGTPRSRALNLSFCLHCGSTRRAAARP